MHPSVSVQLHICSDVVIHNANALSLKAGLDLCGDESTWLFAGWGEAGACTALKATGLLSCL